jgi:hypothetical protein
METFKFPVAEEIVLLTKSNGDSPAGLQIRIREGSIFIELQKFSSNVAKNYEKTSSKMIFREEIYDTLSAVLKNGLK